jgi:hypothetical protein
MLAKLGTGLWLRQRPNGFAGFTVSNVFFSHAGSNPNMKIGLEYLFIKCAITQCL